jgi:transposase InsO family protein
MDVEEVLTAPRSPWQNPYAERLVGSFRRECLDHVIVLGENHLRRILTAFRIRRIAPSVRAPSCLTSVYAFHRVGQEGQDLSGGRIRAARPSPRELTSPAPSIMSTTSFEPSDSLRATGRIHGAIDRETPPAHSGLVYRALKGPKRLLLLPKSGQVWTRQPGRSSTNG